MSNFFETSITAAINGNGFRKNTDFNSSFLDSSLPIYVIGRNDQSAEIIKKINIMGLIDDFNNSTSDWNGVPIVKSTAISRESLIINTVTSISPVGVMSHLKRLGFFNVISIHDLIIDNNHLISLPWFVSEQREEISNHMKWWANLYNKLSDSESKKTLLDVRRFRLTANCEYMNEYTVRLKDQYFESFMDYKDEVFVDAGGFDGDTTEEFIRRYPDYKTVFLFEPSNKNMELAKNRLQKSRDIDFRPVGLSDSCSTLYFDSNSGSACSVSSCGSESIPVVKLDDELNDVPVTFIKMDLEGWEMAALRGSASIIKKRKPKLAIAVYHAAEDFRKIPHFLLDLNPDYRIYLRHYTQGWSETVMFFI